MAQGRIQSSFMTFPSSIILDGDVFLLFFYIENRNRITGVNVAFLTIPKTWREEKFCLPFIPCVDMELFWYHEKWMCIWMPHILYELYHREGCVGDLEMLRKGGEQELWHSGRVSVLSPHLATRNSFC